MLVRALECDNMFLGPRTRSKLCRRLTALCAEVFVMSHFSHYTDGRAAVEVFCHACRRSQRLACRWQDDGHENVVRSTALDGNCGDEHRLWSLRLFPCCWWLPGSLEHEEGDGVRPKLTLEGFAVFEKFLHIIFGVWRRSRANATAESLNLRCLCSLVHLFHVSRATSGAPLRWQVLN